MKEGMVVKSINKECCDTPIGTMGVVSTPLETDSSKFLFIGSDEWGWRGCPNCTKVMFADETVWRAFMKNGVKIYDPV